MSRYHGRAPPGAGRQLQVEGIEGKPHPVMTACHQPCEKVTGSEIPFAWFAHGLRIIDVRQSARAARGCLTSFPTYRRAPTRCRATISPSTNGAHLFDRPPAWSRPTSWSGPERAQAPAAGWAGAGYGKVAREMVAMAASVDPITLELFKNAHLLHRRRDGAHRVQHHLFRRAEGQHGLLHRLCRRRRTGCAAQGLTLPGHLGSVPTAHGRHHAPLRDDIARRATSSS